MKRVIPKWMHGFSEAAKPGSAVPYELVEAFINIREPVAHELGYVQCGVPVRIVHGEEDEPRKYLTFKWSDRLKCWVYIGKRQRWGGYREERIA